jgi:glycosyltransferase A (GT-A) superfamily protein (DUF2064 family)
MIGTDVPSMPLSTYRDALALLERDDMVVGPAEDGGYYAIGLSRPTPELFQDMSWSTPDVLEQTLACAERLGLTAGRLPRCRDVDTVEDLRHAIDEAARDARRPKAQQTFSARTAGALTLLGQRLRQRA